MTPREGGRASAPPDNRLGQMGGAQMQGHGLTLGWVREHHLAVQSTGSEWWVREHPPLPGWRNYPAMSWGLDLCCAQA